MAERVILLLGIHHHQPVGNFPWVLDKAYEDAYLPFLRTVAAHPRVRLTLHYSGVLLEWLASAHPEFLELLGSLVHRGQVEIMTGGYYEPIFAAIYDSDKMGQIRKLTELIREKLNAEPRGLWLAERVWEPHLPEVLAKAGAEYVILDDRHFLLAGLRGAALSGYYLTEEKGKVLRVFPGSERLRYLIPFRPVEETMAYLRRAAQGPCPALAVMGDDGEKFGVWPGTHRSVYQEGWLDRFFEAVEAEQSWLETGLFSEVIGRVPPLGRIYLPTSSYMEMSEWSLIPAAAAEYRELKERLAAAGLEEAARPFLGGGFWRNFLAKYPESNLLHKRMLRVSRLVHGLPDGEVKRAAREELWRGQCNDAYWHGVFGGLYLPHLRSAVQGHLIRAQALAAEAAHRGCGPWIEVVEEDVDKDGRDEILVENPAYSLLLAPGRGGAALAWDCKARSLNLLDTLTRIPEAYHRELAGAAAGAAEPGAARSIHEAITVKEAGLEHALVYDPYPRRGLLDHVFPAGTGLDELASGRDPGVADLVGRPYAAAVHREGDRVRVVLEGGSRLALDGEPYVVVRKEVTAAAGEPRIRVSYRVENRGERPLRDLLFAVETSVNLLAGRAPDRYVRIQGAVAHPPELAGRGLAHGVGEVELVDEWLGLRVGMAWDRPATLFRFPLETVSLSEAGVERIYQGTCLVAAWDLCLPAGGTLELDMSLEAEVRPAAGDRRVAPVRGARTA